jgi:hypothetical protein
MGIHARGLLILWVLRWVPRDVKQRFCFAVVRTHGTASGHNATLHYNG